jgi:predicted RNA-binding protein YlxR (DUF448 family)
VSNKGHRQQRTCLGCGGRDSQANLIRLALMGQDRLAVAKKHGRGGYLHKGSDCWQKFLGRKGHYRAFHAEITKAMKIELIKELEGRDGE